LNNYLDKIINMYNLKSTPLALQRADCFYNFSIYFKVEIGCYRQFCVCLRFFLIFAGFYGISAFLGYSSQTDEGVGCHILIPKSSHGEMSG
jgi:hypothetical protein